MFNNTSYFSLLPTSYQYWFESEPFLPKWRLAIFLSDIVYIFLYIITIFLLPYKYYPVVIKHQLFLHIFWLVKLYLNFLFFIHLSFLRLYCRTTVSVMLLAFGIFVSISYNGLAKINIRPTIDILYLHFSISISVI